MNAMLEASMCTFKFLLISRMCRSHVEILSIHYLCFLTNSFIHVKAMLKFYKYILIFMFQFIYTYPNIL